MILEYQFSCVHPTCRTHAHVRVICHDKQHYDLDRMGAALGFFKKDAFPGEMTKIQVWYCEDHYAHEP